MEKVISKKLRTSRNKKKYWRKGPQLADVEQFMHDEHVDKSEGGVLRERADDALFTLDREPDDTTQKLTRKQLAALNKRKLLESIKAVKEEETEDIKPSKSELKKTFPKKSKRLARLAKKQSQKILTSTSKKPYDLWADDGGGEEPSDEMIAQMRDYCLQTTKRRKPKEPSTLKHITSLLPKVEVAGPGASYNPPVAMYESYINGIVDEEIKAEKVESKLEKALKLAPGQTYVSKSEKMAEESAGLFDNEKQSTEAEDGAANRSDEEMPSAENAKKSTMRRRTRKERRVEALEKQKKLIDEEYKSVKSAEQAVFAVKKINKEISEELTQVNEKAKLRRKQKWTKKLLGTQQLGRGKFKPEEQPFLMTDELTGSLRELKPQGNILMDRLKSLQKRNMLPVPGEEGRVKSKLKKKLKIKETERRSHKEVTLGSRVI